jgi:hypothetical protein
VSPPLHPHPTHPQAARMTPTGPAVLEPQPRPEEPIEQLGQACEVGGGEVDHTAFPAR